MRESPLALHRVALLTFAHHAAPTRLWKRMRHNFLQTRWRPPCGPTATDRNASPTCSAMRCVFSLPPRSTPADVPLPQRVHRSALLWLKEWDQCVFKGGNAKASAATELKRERRKKRAREGKFDAPSTAGGDDEQVRRQAPTFGC